MRSSPIRENLSELDTTSQVHFLRSVQAMSWSGANDLIIQAFQKLQPEVRLVALEAVRFTMERSHRDWLISVFESEPHSFTRWLAFDICCHWPVVRCGDRDWLISNLNNLGESEDVRLSAAQGLLEILPACRSPRTQAVVVDALGSIDPSLAARAEELYGEPLTDVIASKQAS